MEKVLNDNFIHIGLGKTGTTSLQNSVFPKMKEMGIISEYNPPIVKFILDRCANMSSYDLSEEEAGIFKGLKGTFISDERMIGWNPCIWEERCHQIKSIFGSDTTVLITIRDPSSYLRSMYQQVIHQGNVLPPEKFFLNSANYKKYSRITRFRFNEVCDVDSFNYNKLINLYKDNFEKVVVVPMPSINEMKFLSSFTEVDMNSINILSQYVQSAPRKNESYNSLAMNATLLRERLLNLIGLKTFGTNDRYHRKTLTNKAKAEQETQSMVRGFLSTVLTWRGAMQGIFNHMPFTCKYELPKDLYLGKHFSNNVIVYNNILSNEDGYCVYLNNKLKDKRCF